MSARETAIVVGVGAKEGLGAAVCKRFAKEGFHVFVAGRTPEKVEKIAKAINNAGGSASAVACDTTDPDHVVRLFDTAERDGPGPLTAVIYNAGNNHFEDLREMDPEVFERIWRVTCFGGFLVGREAARRIIGQREGTLIFTGATSAVKGRPPSGAFASAKGGLRLLAQAMAREYSPLGLHVGHVIIDGAIFGERIKSRYPQAIEALGEEGMLNIDAIANAYWFLHTQHKSAWTHELDLRPFKENW